MWPELLCSFVFLLKNEGKNEPTTNPHHSPFECLRCARIESTSQLIASSVAPLGNPAAYAPGGNATAINRDLSALSHDLARLMAEWETVTTTVNVL
jgi:hypothetical protein